MLRAVYWLRSSLRGRPLRLYYDAHMHSSKQKLKPIGNAGGASGWIVLAGGFSEVEKLRPALAAK